MTNIASLKELCTLPHQGFPHETNQGKPLSPRRLANLGFNPRLRLHLSFFGTNTVQEEISQTSVNGTDAFRRTLVLVPLPVNRSSCESLGLDRGSGSQGSRHPSHCHRWLSASGASLVHRVTC